MKQKLEKWETWLKTVSQEIEHLAASQQIYRETVKIILSNGSLPKENIFLDFLQEWYVHSIVMGLRRQLKTGDANVSLVGLLKDVAGASCFLSRERFVNLVIYDGRGTKQPNETFDKYVGKGTQFLASQKICEDLRKFKDIAKKCEEYADRLVAHRDKRGVPEVPIYKDLEEALTFMSDLLKKYSLLIRGNELRTVQPVIPQNWTVIFKQPWIQEDRIA